MATETMKERIDHASDRLVEMTNEMNDTAQLLNEISSNMDKD